MLSRHRQQSRTFVFEKLTPHNRKVGVGLYLSRGRNLGKSRVLCSRRLTSTKPPRSKGSTLSSLMRTSAVTIPRQVVFQKINKDVPKRGQMGATMCQAPWGRGPPGGCASWTLGHLGPPPTPPFCLYTPCYPKTLKEEEFHKFCCLSMA